LLPLGAVIHFVYEASSTSWIAHGARAIYDIVAGTKSVFYQAAAPLLWTVDNTGGDKALRWVSGTSGLGGSAGGSSVFSDVFTARTITQANLPDITLTTTSNGAHTHTYNARAQATNVDLSHSGGETVAQAVSSTATSSDGAHTHSVSLGGSGTAMDFAVQYRNVIMATRN
jgi:hypothetical protein